MLNCDIRSVTDPRTAELLCDLLRAYGSMPERVMRLVHDHVYSAAVDALGLVPTADLWRAIKGRRGEPEGLTGPELCDEAKRLRASFVEAHRLATEVCVEVDRARQRISALRAALRAARQRAQQAEAEVTRLRSSETLDLSSGNAPTIHELLTEIVPEDWQVLAGESIEVRSPKGEQTEVTGVFLRDETVVFVRAKTRGALGSWASRQLGLGYFSIEFIATVTGLEWASREVEVEEAETQTER